MYVCVVRIQYIIIVVLIQRRKEGILCIFVFKSVPSMFSSEQSLSLWYLEKWCKEVSLFIFALQKCALNDTCLILWLAQWAPPTAIAGLKDAESSMHAPHSMPPSTYMRSTCSAWRPLFSHTSMQNAIGICEVHSLKSQCYRTKYIHSVHRTIKKSDPVCLFLETFLDHLTLAKVLYLLCSRLGWGSRCSIEP